MLQPMTPSVALRTGSARQGHRCSSGARRLGLATDHARHAMRQRQSAVIACSATVAAHAARGRQRERRVGIEVLVSPFTRPCGPDPLEVWGAGAIARQHDPVQDCGE
jgi:hypothetical protein